MSADRHPLAVATAPTAAAVGRGCLRRKCACGNHASGDECESCSRQRLHRKGRSGATDGTVPAIVHAVLQSPGQAFDQAARQPFERGFGRDFGHVRIHADELAAQSARAVGALAYTVGPHLVFAAGQYAPHVAQGRELLAHELTHVVQQAAPAGTDSVERDEAEADRVAGAFALGRALPAIGGGGHGLRKQDAPKATDGAAEASRAESQCDLPALCRLGFAHPQVVNTARVVSAYRKCRPTSPVPSAPCLELAVMVPMPPAPSGPLATPATPGPTAGGAEAGGLHLPDTTLKFHLGGLEAELSLPSSLKASLPVRYHGARLLQFELNASASGGFSLSVTLDATRHVSISLKAGVSVGKQPQASAGLEIAFGGQVCQSEDPLTAKDKLESAGKKLHDAVAAAQKAPEIDKLKDVVSAIKDVHDEIDAAKAKCKPTPRFTIGVGAHTPLGPFSPQIPPTDSDRALSPYVGLKFEGHF